MLTTQPFDELKALAIKLHWKIISDHVMVRPDRCVEFRCPIGHTQKIKRDNFLKNPVCGLCTYDMHNVINNEADMYVFRSLVEELGGKVIGNYTQYGDKILCQCSQGHDCYPNILTIQRCPHLLCGVCKEACIQVTKPANKKADVNEVRLPLNNNNVKIRRVKMCGKKSSGARLVEMSLNILGYEVVGQAKHERIPRLYFDYLIIRSDGIRCFIEFDGQQHQDNGVVCYKRFGKNPEERHAQARQRDLVKNMIIRESVNCMLIRIDHNMVRKPNYIREEALIDHIEKCISSTDKIVCNRAVYNWIDDLPSDETISKYVV